VNSPVLERWWGRRINRYVAAFILILLLVAWASSYAHRGQTISLQPTANARLARGAPISIRQVSEVHMHTLSEGIGLAVVPQSTSAPSRTYLVATTDGGSTWRVTNYLPTAAYLSQTADSLIGVGSDLYYYVQYPRPVLSVSTNAGRSWRRVAVVGQLLSAESVGSDLWVTTDRCARTTTRGKTWSCGSYLYVYAPGRLVPPPGHLVPGSVSTDASQPTPSSLRPRAATVFAALGSDGGVLLDASAGQPGAGAIVETLDAGTSWQSVTNPCGRAFPGTLLANSLRRWILHCTLDQGMNQGLNELFTSTDRGFTWHLIAAANGARTLHVGRFGDGMSAAFSMSNDGAILWQVSTVGPSSESVNGGSDWIAARPNIAAPSQFDSVGARGAFIVSRGAGIWRTADGVHWRFLH
jgi:hypothetical protein